MVAGGDAEGVQVGDQVAPDAIGVDELEDSGLLGDFVEAAFVAEAESGTAAVGHPPDRLIGHPGGDEDLVIEALFALEEGLDFAQKDARLGALDNAVIVGTRHRHHLADTKLSAQVLADALEFRGEVDGPGGDDGALAGHEAGDGAFGADGAGVGERDGGAGEVVGGQFTGA